MSSIQYYPGYSQTQVYQNLRVQTILAITNSYPMVITTAANHNYPAGVIVSCRIPYRFPMQQLNGLNLQVIAVTSNTLSISLDSTNFDAFSYPAELPSAYTPPSVFAVSSGPFLNYPPPLPYANQDSFEGVIYNDGLNNGN